MMMINIVERKNFHFENYIKHIFPPAIHPSALLAQVNEQSCYYSFICKILWGVSKLCYILNSITITSQYALQVADGLKW